MERPQELKKTLGLFQLLAFGVAGVLGASWIYTNSALFSEHGAGGVVLGLAVAVVLAAFVALAYAELTTAFPRAGGEVVFSYIALGRRSSFFTGWMLIGAYVSSLAFYVTAFGYLLERFFPSFAEIPLYTINDETVTLPILGAGVILTLILLVLNWFGVNIGGQVQLVMFFGIIVIGVSLAVVGFASGSPDNFFPAYYADQNPLADTLRFIIPSMTFLAGFGLVAVLAEDSKLTPKKTGFTVVFTVIGAGLFYCVVLAATAWVYPWQEVADMELGTVSAFEMAGYTLLSHGAYAIAMLGLLTSFLGLFVASSRIIVAMGRAEMLPSGLAKLHPRHGTPTNALLFTTAVTLALGWIGPGAIVWFLDTGGVYLGLVWFMVVVAKYKLPSRYPKMDRPYVSKFSWLPAIGGIGALLIIVWAIVPGTGASLVWPAEYLMLGAWLILGVIMWMLSKKKSRKESLGAMLGDEVYAQIAPFEDDAEQIHSATRES
ncbi:MAG TPA: APC family permease [Candidatus Yaniella excrementigallinarum]|nr:APC family permease [Candidatus Yaniella excrementigallinarum]